MIHARMGRHPTVENDPFTIQGLTGSVLSKGSGQDT